MLNHVTETYSVEFNHVLRNRESAISIDHIRNEYWNPACHGDKVTFSPTEYGDLCMRAIGVKRYAEWNTRSIEVHGGGAAGLIHDTIVAYHNACANPGITDFDLQRFAQYQDQQRRGT